MEIDDHFLRHDKQGEEQVFAEQLRLLYGSTTLGCIVQATIISFLSLAQMAHAPTTHIAMILSYFAVAIGLRIGLNLAYQKISPDPAQAQKWINYYTLVVAFNGIGWMIAAYLFITTSAEANLIFTGLVLGGVSTGALVSLAVHLPSYYIFLVPTMSSGIFLYIQVGTTISYYTAALGVLLMGFLLIMAKRLNLILLSNISLKFEYKFLFDDLTHSREQGAASEKNYRVSIDATSEGYWRIDLQGRILDVNRAACEMLGRPSEDVLGKLVIDFSSEKSKPTHNFQLSKIEGTNHQNYQLDLLNAKGGVVQTSVHATTNRNAQGKAIDAFAFFTDITESNKVRNLQAEMDTIIAANQAKSSFMASMSHELRTPLNAIIGFSEMMENEYLGPIGNDQYKEYATDIKNSGEFLLSLVSEILNIEQIEKGKFDLHFEAIDISVMADECLKLIGKSAEKKAIALNILYPVDLPPLSADRRAIIQILTNLITNAIKYTESGGQVSLAMSAVNSTHLFEVSDNGIGIPEDKIANLTDPFSRHQDDPLISQEGVGLGLAITSSLVELHGGSLEIISEVAKGTTVTVTLPSSPKSINHKII